MHSFFKLKYLANPFVIVMISVMFYWILQKTPAILDDGRGEIFFDILFMYWVVALIVAIHEFLKHRIRVIKS